MASSTHDNTMPPPSFSRVAAVTGANKGIGLTIVRQLALGYPSSALKPCEGEEKGGGRFLIYLCSRDQKRGEEAVKKIENDGLLKEAKALVKDGGLTDVRYYGLDVGVEESVMGFKGFLEREHGAQGGIDVVVNNAGVAMRGFGILNSRLPYLSEF